MAEPVLPPVTGEAEHYNLATPAGEAGPGAAPGVAGGTEAEPREEHEPIHEQICTALQVLGPLE
eukprot:4679139-Alexandrium_andersonii.AAC.1